MNSALLITSLKPCTGLKSWVPWFCVGRQKRVIPSWLARYKCACFKDMNLNPFPGFLIDRYYLTQMGIAPDVRYTMMGGTYFAKPVLSSAQTVGISCISNFSISLSRKWVWFWKSRYFSLIGQGLPIATHDSLLRIILLSRACSRGPTPVKGRNTWE